LDKCCKTPIGDLATPDVLKMCTTKTDAKFSTWVNDYMLNKIQLSKKSNGIDINDKNTGIYNFEFIPESEIVKNLNTNPFHLMIFQ
jgi:hypothetical protein